MDVHTRTEGQVLTDRYVLERRLGTGGAGVVWRAHDRVLQRAVAVKLLHPELAHDPGTAARFRSEASSAAKLTHPNAVIVYDIGRDDDRDFLVMELVDGPALSELMAAGPLPAETVAHLGASIASALGLAHQRGMLHRDVKPANVLLTEAGVPKVADFGIARALGEATARLTAPGSVMGTARYLAPEQMLEGPLDGRVDVYALGLVLHEALTGKAPWGGGTALEIATRRLHADLRPPSTLRTDVPPGLDAVVARATRLDADERFADGAAMALALAPLAGPQGRRELARLLGARERPGTPDTPSDPGEGGSRSVGGGPPAARSRRPAPSPAARRPAPHPTPSPERAVAPRAADGGMPRRAGAGTGASTVAVPDPPARAPSRRSLRGSTRRPDRTRRDRRSERPRRRGRRLLGVLVLLAAAAFAGSQIEVPGVGNVVEQVRDSDVGELLRDVRDGLPDQLRG